jgi:hypothetical protein
MAGALGFELGAKAFLRTGPRTRGSEADWAFICGLVRRNARWPECAASNSRLCDKREMAGVCGFEQSAVRQTRDGPSLARGG